MTLDRTARLRIVCRSPLFWGAAWGFFSTRMRHPDDLLGVATTPDNTGGALGFRTCLPLQQEDLCGFC